MNKKSSDFLKLILETPSPTGMEIEAQRLWAKYIAPFTDSQECDAYGSTWATLRSANPDAPTLMLDAHADEIGFSIRHITNDGFAYVERLGGSDVAIARGRRLRFFGKKGEVMGIIGNTAIHIRDDDGKSPKLWDLYVDFGCNSREEVEALGLRVGDRAVYCDGPLMLNSDKRLVCRALDDRLCGFILAETARTLHEKGITPAWNIIFANSVQEEVGCIGAGMLTYRLAPDAAICLDVTHATDTPALSSSRYGEVKLGLGPCLCIGPACHPSINNRLEDIADKEHLPLQRETSGRTTGTNTDSIFRSRSGVPTTNLSLPLRYMHSPVETADMDDVQATIDLLVAFIASLQPTDSFHHKLA
ncbi:MAG: M42 family metallopeptidase [Akkermansiaceae bacterium]|nr:M42 family metallopeptidase [Akkermansiaceae bacterium]